MINLKDIGIAFDLEGTVVDLEKLHHNAHLELFRRVGLNLSLDEAMKKIEHFAGGPDKAIMEDVHKLGYNSMFIEEMEKIDKRLYEEQLFKQEIVSREGFIEFLQKVKELGVSFSIGSVTDSDKALYILKKSGLCNNFSRDMIILKEDVKELKPSPEVYLKTAERMGISPDRQIVFEDSHNGVKAAISANSKAIGMPVYHTPFVVNRLKEAGASNVFLSWKGLNPKQIIKEIFEVE